MSKSQYPHINLSIRNGKQVSLLSVEAEF